VVQLVVHPAVLRQALALMTSVARPSLLVTLSGYKGMLN